MSNDTVHIRSQMLPFTVSVPAALVVTGLLVLLMQSLIATDMPLVIDEKHAIAELIRVDPEPPRIEKSDPPEKIEDTAPPPDWAAPQSEIHPEGSELAWRGEALDPVLEESTEIGYGSGAIVAYLKTQPVYPSRALSRGIEGYVDLAFDITPAGSTTNIRVLEAQPSGVFERAAINALQKWKYKVPVVDDEPQGQVDMMTRMSFEIDE